MAAIMTDAGRETGEMLRGHAAGAPERLAQKWRVLLAGTDFSGAFLVSLLALNGVPGDRAAAALVTAAIVCAIFWLCGFYRRSYAMLPRDEAYYACTGVLLAAVPVWLILALVASVPALSIAVSLLLCALTTGIVRVYLHRERRASAPRFYAGIASITPGAWQDRESQTFCAAKRGLDLLVASAALLLSAPLMIGIAIAVKLDSAGSVFFRQERAGKDGRAFIIYKFRTMRQDAGSQWAKPGDNRITRAGAWLRRTSLDELPQLFNVLLGEMSMVGPRPEMLSFARSFDQTMQSYAQRHIVAPGITGWSQLYLKRNLQPSDMPGVLPYDLFYVEHACVPLDVALILKTAAEFLFHRAV